ncbi:MAG: CAP domain-containing protein [Verrucomicrobia bacterium]|nr:CAP domain-containing protein [Verrucomicrobiota bacterium]
MKPALRCSFFASLLLATPLTPLWAAPTQQYSHGDPTPAEQLILEYMNRARANPTQEGIFLTSQNDQRIQQAITFFQVSLPGVRSAFAALPPQPPLALNPKLTEAVRFAANDQATKNYQGHVSSDGSTIVTRAQRAGYTDFMGLGENTYTRVFSPLFGHCGFNIDWGVPSLGHRINIMNIMPNTPVVFKECGVAYQPVSNSSLANVFPNVSTQNFGITFTDAETPYLVGVVYRDADANNFYSEGEGRGGITVMPDVGTFFAVTSTSGGYAIPLKNLPPGTTSVNVTFSGPGVPSVTRTVTLDGVKNLKLDYQVPAAPPSRLVNLSTRLRVETGAAVGIAGFVVQGTSPKRVIVRVAGPSLIPFGIQDALADPSLQLNDSNGATVATNDNWRSSQQADIQGSGFAPANDSEAAIIATLAPGAYTAIVTGANGTTGIGIVEVYDLDAADATSKAINVSTRGRVQTGAAVMIAGFVIQGSTPKKVVVRVLGPSLLPFGIQGALLDPVIELSSNGNIVATNDSWRATQQAELQALSLAPGDDREAAIVATLPPGAYSAVVRGAGNTSGIAIVEVYDKD